MEENLFWEKAGSLFKAHPWHGVSIGKSSPSIITAYIEVVPGDTIKYELDKASGYLKIDRPQSFSSICPTLYGLVPQTYAGPRVADLCNKRLGRTDIKGDGDPLDICVLTERIVPYGDILLNCRPIGGFRMIDGGEADDKIIAVMNDDAVYEDMNDINKVPRSVLNRLRHYFLTYKQSPDDKKPRCEIAHIYSREEAYEVIRRSRLDYEEKFPGVSEVVRSLTGK